MWFNLVLFLFWFRSFTCTVRLLFHSLLETVRERVHLKLDVQGQGVRNLFWCRWTGGRGSGKLDNFHGPHMCIVPNKNNFECLSIQEQIKPFLTGSRFIDWNYFLYMWCFLCDLKQKMIILFSLFHYYFPFFFFTRIFE